ncbi:MAG: DUF373 family protein [Candidatus Thermoplasmatota archaeon]|nr:DUF373 family protein [Candidatus Thermoplasmatota archaeon]MDP7264695.1 DUF373 family protein [Candidatus Thermoplasmatota archaeon]
MKTLVLCVDRDDDMGEKASIISPIIGRKENLDAAVALALADPEDSDVNTSMAGIKIYDELKRDGRSVEIVTICGDKRVGKRSDEVIATQLDIVIKEIEPTGVILVSDGAEDEFITPVVTSRITVDSIERVVVKQRKSIEDTYYLITRLMSDDKIQKKFMLPVALLLFFWGISSGLAASINFPDIGIPIILVIIGGYLLVKIYHLEEGAVRFARDFRAGVEKGYISTFTGIFAVILVVFAIGRAALEVNKDPQSTMIESTVIILSDSLWYLIAAGGLYTIGRLLDIYIRKGYLVSSIILTLFSLISSGLVIMVGIDILKYYIGLTDIPNIMGIFGWLGLAVLIFIIGRIPYNYARTGSKIAVKLKY